MLNTVRAVMREGKIELLEPLDVPEGTTVLVTPLIRQCNVGCIRCTRRSFSNVLAG